MRHRAGAKVGEYLVEQRGEGSWATLGKAIGRQNPQRWSPFGYRLDLPRSARIGVTRSA
jgi:hypothetical protein